MNKQNAFNIFFRYLFLLILGLGNLFIFYVIFTPLTIYPVKFILSSFYSLMHSFGATFVKKLTYSAFPFAIPFVTIMWLFDLTKSSPNLVSVLSKIQPQSSNFSPEVLEQFSTNDFRRFEIGDGLVPIFNSVTKFFPIIPIAVEKTSISKNRGILMKSFF